MIRYAALAALSVASAVLCLLAVGGVINPFVGLLLAASMPFAGAMVMVFGVLGDAT